MVPRYTGAALGLAAFSTAIVIGLWAGNPFSVILSRAMWGMFLFCLIGLLGGAVAQAVLNEYAQRRAEEPLPEAALLLVPPSQGGADAPSKAGAAEARSAGS